MAPAAFDNPKAHTIEDAAANVAVTDSLYIDPVFVAAKPSNVHPEDTPMPPVSKLKSAR
jgi:hypothetical protein